MNWKCTIPCLSHIPESTVDHHLNTRYNPISSRLFNIVKHGVLCIHGLKNDCSYVFSDLAWRVFYCISNDCERDAVVVGAGWVGGRYPRSLGPARAHPRTGMRMVKRLSLKRHLCETSGASVVCDVTCTTALYKWYFRSSNHFPKPHVMANTTLMTNLNPMFLLINFIIWPWKLFFIPKHFPDETREMWRMSDVSYSEIGLCLTIICRFLFLCDRIKKNIVDYWWLIIYDAL